MMKLTVAFLGALAAADAAEARNHRQARRQYYGGGYGGGEYSHGGNTAVSSPVKPVETPKVSVPYVQSSAAAFKTSLPVDAASSYAPSSAAVPVVSSKPVVPASSPAVPEASSKPVDYGNGYGTNPASSSAKVPSNSGVVPGSSVVPSGALPSSSAAKPSGGYGGGFSASSVAPASSKVPSNSGVYPPAGGVGASGSVVPIIPTGTGSKPSATPVTDMVTKTIYSTQIYQISSKLVSTVVPVGTTVCPKDQASATPEASTSAMKVYTSSVPVSEVTKKVTETLVYTVGVGSTAHPVTTEVVSTSTSTVYKTVVITLAKPTPSPAGGYPVGGQGSQPAGEETSTKTVKSTSTTTKYITVKPTPASTKVPVGTEGTPVPGGPAGGENCAVPTTVTVTAKETVYVTKGQENGKPTPGAPAPGMPSAPAGPAYPEGTPVKPSGGAGMPVKPSAKPSGGMYPIHNGTNPYPAGPTGFHTSAKPSVPVGTASVPVPSKATSSLPAFSFVSETPVKTPSKETGVPVPSASSPAVPEASSKPVEYGNGYGAAPAPSSSKVVVETPTPAVSTPAVPTTKVPSNEQSTPAAKPTPTPVGNGGYGNGYGTY